MNFKDYNSNYSSFLVLNHFNLTLSRSQDLFIFE